jgi:hypothetical protein
MTHRYLTVAFILAWCAAFAQSPRTVTISGTVIDDSGAPVAGALVHYNNSPATKTDAYGHVHRTEPFLSSHVVTATDGTFAITALPPSLYWLCAAGVTPVQLRSCDWGQATNSVDLRTAADASGIKLQVVNGLTLTFQVTDAQGKINAGNFRIFVVDQTRYMDAGLTSVEGSVHNYSLAVPKGRALTLFLDTALQVTDSASKAILPLAQATNIQLTVQ